MHSLRFFGTCLLLGGLAWTSPVMADAPSNDGIAQDDEGEGEGSDDVDMSDIIDGGDGEETPEQETRGLQDGTGEDGEIVLIEDDGKKGGVIRIRER